MNAGFATATNRTARWFRGSHMTETIVRSGFFFGVQATRVNLDPNAPDGPGNSSNVPGQGSVPPETFHEGTVFSLFSRLYQSANDSIAKAKDAMFENAIDHGWLPHFVIRTLIKIELGLRANEISCPTLEAAYARKMEFIEELRVSPIAIHTDAANQQRYEVTTGIMGAALGPRMKYSCCLWGEGIETLDKAEEEMLGSYVEKIGFEDGMSLLDVGCGLGDALFYFAERFPNSRIVGFTNSRTQKDYVVFTAQQMGLHNVTAIKGDVAIDDIGENEYDRMISCEMFEHLKNYDSMMAKISRALKPGGKFLLQMFCHRDAPYHVSEGWMATYFFTGGTMPSADLLLYFQKEDLQIRKQWWIHGQHYNKTIEAWLANFVANKDTVWPYLVEMYGTENAAVWFNRWQVHYLAWSELFISGDGEAYGVTHLLFEKSGSKMSALEDRPLVAFVDGE